MAALVQANHGLRPWLTICGKQVGQMMPEGRLIEKETGSIIVILATDAPLSPLSLRALAKHTAIGIGRDTGREQLGRHFHGFLNGGCG